MTTDEALLEIASYTYRSTFYKPKISLYYNDMWIVLWSYSEEFWNNPSRYAKTQNEACLKALEFIKNNPQFFTKKL